jgi:Ni/Fe-hydrogenase b-type cytochrome subunit
VEPGRPEEVAPPSAPPLRLVRAEYQHPWAIRFTHWLNAVSIFVLVASGLRIFTAFPSFGPKVPQKDFVNIPAALTLGGWLGGALRWHFTFMWIFGGAGLLYVVYQFASGRSRRAFIRWRDLGGVWPMARHYFLFGPKPAEDETQMYNPLQKLAYTTIVLCGVLALLTGMVLYKPVQFSGLARLFGGYHLTRIWHFVAMCGFVGFVPGHVLMVILHGRDNFVSMWTGWKRLR